MRKRDRRKGFRQGEGRIIEGRSGQWVGLISREGGHGDGDGKERYGLL